MTLEKVVRPFQQGDVFTARQTIPAQQPSGGTVVSTDNATLTWSGINPGQYTQTPDLQLVGFTVKWPEDDTKRVTETQRVENPNDPTQYVMVERLKSATFNNSRTGESFNLQFADWDKNRKSDAGQDGF